MTTQTAISAPRALRSGRISADVAITLARFCWRWRWRRWRSPVPAAGFGRVS